MLPNYGSRRMYVTMELANERVRSRLSDQIEHRRSQGLSKMAAYDAVAASLGKSPSWVRKIIGRSPLVSASAADWFNLETLCAKLDAVSERLETRAAQIRDSDAGNQARAIAPAPRQGVLEFGDGPDGEVRR